MELPFERPDNDWQRVSRAALIAWLVFYLLLLLQASRAQAGDYLLFDWVNFFPHEGGHLLFSYLGEMMMYLGGTLTQLLVPFLVAGYFVWYRKTPAVAFAAFWFFENFLNIGTYMADARIHMLPLVGPGGGDPESHDWTNLFSMWNMLDQSEKIGRATRAAGWIGMLATCAWLVWMARRQWAGEEARVPSTEYRVASRIGAGQVAAAGAPAGPLPYVPPTEPPAPQGQPANELPFPVELHAAAPVATAPRGSETLLLLEPDPALRQVLAAMLRRKGYAVLEAAEATQAIEADQRHERPISLLISIPLPGPISATELVERLRAQNAALRILLTPGAADSAAVRRLLPAGVARLEKPFTADVLARKVREVLDA